MSTSSAQASFHSIAADSRLTAHSYFWICWKVTPQLAPSPFCVMPSSLRRAFSRRPTTISTPSLFSHPHRTQTVGSVNRVSTTENCNNATCEHYRENVIGGRLAALARGWLFFLFGGVLLRFVLFFCFCFVRLLV